MIDGHYLAKAIGSRLLTWPGLVGGAWVLSRPESCEAADEYVVTVQGGKVVSVIPLARDGATIKKGE